MRKPCIIVDGYTYRISSELKCQQISWQCSAIRQKCRAKLKTDLDITRVLSGCLEHNHEPDECKNERKVLRTCVKQKAADDASARPSKLIRKELSSMSEENLQPADLKSVRQALYRERWKKYPKLPKSREETLDALDSLDPILMSKNCRA